MRIYEKRCSESQDMVYKFQELFSATRKSLRNKRVAVSELIYHLECLGSIQPIYKDAGQSLLRYHLPELAKAENVDDVMSVVRNYCSFFDYHMLEHVINEFGTQKDIENLTKYKVYFNKYAQNCIECPSVLGQMNDSHATMFVTLDDSFENCTWSHLCVFINDLRKILKIPSGVVLKLCRISPGSMRLTFQLSHYVQQYTFPLSTDQEACLSAHSIIQLSCGEYKFEV